MYNLCQFWKQNNVQYLNVVIVNNVVLPNVLYFFNVSVINVIPLVSYRAIT